LIHNSAGTIVIIATFLAHLAFRPGELLSSGTFWLKIEQFWPFEEISIFSNGCHLGYRTALTDTILKGDHSRIISAKFG
jgi:hypothetical protein